MQKCAAFAAAALLAAVAVAGDEIKSGLPVGENVPAFNVRDITGPNQGKTLCYRCSYGARPVVTIFTKKIDENVASLIKQVDDTVGKNGDAKMAAFVVLLTEDADKAEGDLKKLAESAKIKNTPLTIIEGLVGPPEYKLSADAETTVMMWVESEVKVSQGFGKGKLDKKAVEALVGDTKKILN